MTIPADPPRPQRRAPPPPGRTGLVLRDPMPWEQLVQLAETAEDTRYEALFVPEIAGREAFATLAGLAGPTARLRLGTGVVTIQSRTAVSTAMGAATVQDLSGGRMVLGLGAGSPGPGPGHGGGAIETVRRWMGVLRSILAGESVTSTELGIEGFELALALEEAPPIWLGALGDRMISLAGEAADGVLLNWCTPDRVAEASALVRRGAERAGRDPEEVTVAVYVRACLGVEDAVALAALRPMTGQYAAIPHYLRQMERMGLGEDASAAARAFQASRPDQVPEGLVRRLTVLGGRSEALSRFKAFRDAGADLVLCYPVSVREPFSSVLGTILTAAPSTAIER